MNTVPSLYSEAQKIWHNFLYAVTFIRGVLTDFLNFFTVRIRRKFAKIHSLKIQPHLKCVPTLPCEMSLSRANCRSVSMITPLVSVVASLNPLSSRSCFLVLFNLLLRHDNSQGSVATHLRYGWIFSDKLKFCICPALQMAKNCS